MGKRRESVYVTIVIVFFFNDTATTEIYTLSLHDALPILKGIFSLRGKIVSVIDVAARLGLKTGKESGKRKIIILDLGSDRFGLLVDTIEHLAGLDIQVLEPPPESFTAVPRDFVEGVFHHSGHAVAFMNLPMFFNFTH